MAKKTLTFLLFSFLAIFLTYSFPLVEAKSLNIKTSDSLYISIDFRDSSKMNLELSLVNKINLKGEYAIGNKSLKIKVSIEDLDLTELSKYISLPMLGYIKKGDLDVKINETISLEGEIEANELKLTNKNIDIKGSIKLLGYLKVSDQGLDYHVNYQIKDGYFSKLKNITGIQAKGFLKKDRLLLNQSDLIYKNLPLKITAKIEDFLSPKVNLEILSTLCNLEIQAKINGKVLQVPELIIHNKDSEIITKINIDLNKSRVEIQGEGSISITTLTKILDSFRTQPSSLAKLNPQGSINLKFTLIKKSEQDKGKIELQSDSEQLQIKDFKIRDIKATFLKEANRLTISSLRAKVSDGEINLKGMLNLSDNKGNLNLTVNDVDIAQIANELNIKGEKPQGKLFLETNLVSLDFFKWQNLRGEGKILVNGGNIYQINFLKGLGKVLSILDFENIVFTEASSDLFFEKQDIFFENFQLNSDQMNIGGKGKITTLGNLDFLIFPQFSEELIDSSKGLQKYITALLGERGFSVNIGGTVGNPTYTPNISILPSLDKLKEIEDIFKDFIKW